MMSPFLFMTDEHHKSKLVQIQLDGQKRSFTYTSGEMQTRITRSGNLKQDVVEVTSKNQQDLMGRRTYSKFFRHGEDLDLGL